MASLLESLRGRGAAIAVVGLGYVGLPLSVALARKFRIIGFDVSEPRIEELRSGLDRTGEVESEVLRSRGIDFTTDPERLREARLLIIAVPTPIDGARVPDLSLVRSACRAIGRNLSKGSVVVLESTVYPGVTEEVCAPIIEEESGLRRPSEFRMAYSPERINPGDKEHTFEKIVKVVSAEDAESLEVVAGVYGDVVAVPIHRAPNIKTAEAAKVIENIQRDLNIALMNELAIIFHRLGIDTQDVLAAAGTKWNFLKFYPGLVGGHCIGVDPYYLTFRAEAAGYHPEVILAGRRINDTMGTYVAQWTVKELVQSGRIEPGLSVAVLGLTFKENLCDIRNTKVVDIVRELESFGLNVSVTDPVADAVEVEREYGIRLKSFNELSGCSAMIAAVAHDQYRRTPAGRLRERMVGPALLIDLKAIFDKEECRAAGIEYRRL